MVAAKPSRTARGPESYARGMTDRTYRITEIVVLNKADVADPDAIEPELTETVEALRDWLLRVDPAAVAAGLRRRAWPAARPAPIRPLAQAAAIEALRAEGVI